MIRKARFARRLLVPMMVVAVGLSACSSNDDDDDAGDTDNSDDTSELNEDLVSLSLELDSTSTVPPANVDGATGTGIVTVDTSTGAIAGSVAVSGTTGAPDAAHVHMGAAGEAGPVVIGMTGNADGSEWTIPDGSALDAAGIESFNNGELYINVHTEANPAGELRTQLIDADVPAAGSVTIAFRNLSNSQPLTPPVVALHNAPDAENGIRLYEVGTPASEGVREIAENGNIQPLLDAVLGQINAGTVSDGGAAAPEAGGPLLPGDTSSITLMPEMPDQVLSFVSMVVCTNDGFTGVDSIDITDGTFNAAIYDAGTETNVLTLAYWVPPCSGGEVTSNLTDIEGGVITAHPGQSGSEVPAFDFVPGSEVLEVTVTVN